MTLLRALRTQLGPFGNPWAVGSETLLLPLFAVGIGIWVNPLDPLWVHANFPWAWFAPVILAMRYGPFPGLGGATVLLISWALFSASGWITGEFPKLNFLGGLILVMLAGEFSSLWLARARRAEGVQFYLDQRLEYLTHQYYLLRLSHDRLEQDLIGRPMAMRDALTSLQELIHTSSAREDGSPFPGAEGLIRLLAQYCQLEAAALYPVGPDGPVDPPVARIGSQGGAEPLDLDDPLLAQALEAGSLSHVAELLSMGKAPSRYVIAVPMKNLQDTVIGLLVVERVPFFALHEEMLQTLNLLVSYYVDGLDTQRLAEQIRDTMPICPPEFAAELQRLHRVMQSSDAGSVITALEFANNPDCDDIAMQLQRQRRALDINWLIDSPQRKVLVTLMPLAGQAAAEGYIARIEDWMRKRNGKTLREAGVFPHILNVDAAPPVALLERLFKICNVPVETRLRRTDA